MTIFQNPTFTLVNGGVNFVVDISILPDPEVFLYLYNYYWRASLHDWVVWEEGIADISVTARGPHSDVSLNDSSGDTAEEEKEKNCLDSVGHLELGIKLFCEKSNLKF